MGEHLRRTDFERGFSDYSQGLKDFLCRRLGSEVDAEDALQEIYCNLFRSAGDDLTAIANLPAWLYRAARNILSNLNRRHRSDDIDDEELLNLIADKSEEQEFKLLRQMFWSELETALSELPAEQRQVWELTELEGVPAKEIARAGDLPLATVLSRKYYAVKHLRKRLRILYNDIITN